MSDGSEASAGEIANRAGKMVDILVQMRQCLGELEAAKVPVAAFAQIGSVPATTSSGEHSKLVLDYAHLQEEFDKSLRHIFVSAKYLTGNDEDMEKKYHELDAYLDSGRKA